MRNKDRLEILSITEYPKDLYKISNELELEDMIEDIMRVIRTSREYRGIVFWYRAKHNLSIDAIESLDAYNFNKLTIDIHHWPIPLYDICYLVGMKMLKDNPKKEFLSFDIASKVIDEHFNDRIGVVPLLRSDHEKYHENLLELKKEMIHGKYLEFIQDYKRIYFRR